MVQTYNKLQQPLRTVPELGSRKLQKLLQMTKMPCRSVQMVAIEKEQELSRWTGMLELGIARDEQGWFRVANSCLIFVKEDASEQALDPVKKKVEKERERIANSIKVMAR